MQLGILILMMVRWIHYRSLRGLTCASSRCDYLSCVSQLLANLISDIESFSNFNQTKYVSYLESWCSLTAYLVSPFDEKLAEDRRVNRLEDSYLLWRSVVSCKLLARTQIILCKWHFWNRKLCFDWRGRNKFWTSVIFYKRSFKEESEYEIQFQVSETARTIFLPLRDVSVYLDSDRTT